MELFKRPFRCGLFGGNTRSSYLVDEFERMVVGGNDPFASGHPLALLQLLHTAASFLPVPRPLRAYTRSCSRYYFIAEIYLEKVETLFTEI